MQSILEQSRTKYITQCYK